MTARDVRRTFLDFFAQHDHHIVASAPLVPVNDPTLLFTNAGMTQFKALFLGQERRDYVRAVSAQTCMRVSGKHNDLDSVGPSLRHHTFFEMLGNFSFGDYFKDEAILFAWQLLTEVWRLPPERLWATVFRGDASVPRDDEAHGLWRRFLPDERIDELGVADNFWAMGDTGPCGRCSEIHYFQGANLPCTAPTCLGTACTCDRYVEMWNNVFMEFDRQVDGTLQPLPARSIDTGMGLERITAVLAGTTSNYDTDLFRPLLTAIGDLVGSAYGQDSTRDVSMRVVADHLRAMTFLIGDGVTPSNEWRGYVLRKIMRRAMRHGKRLGFAEPSLHRLADVVIADMGDAYPRLKSDRDAIVQIVRGEEERFDAVLSAGLPKLEAALDRAAAGDRRLPGTDVFTLHDSLGLPVDFVEDLAGERQVTIDREGFERLMEGQRQRARAGSRFKAPEHPLTWTTPPDAAPEYTAAGDQFLGYDTTGAEDVPIIMVWNEDGLPSSGLKAEQSGYVALEKTPFYVESGGQVSDTGWITSADHQLEAVVEGMVGRRPSNLPRIHGVRVTQGALARGDRVSIQVDDARRDATRRNHTATHLLHATLRQVLGVHVKQAGSLVAPDRLRFDFAYSAPLTAEQIDEIECDVNAQIVRNAAVETDVRPTKEAMAAGAIALFGEKYGERVRVVAVPGFSMELCGGTHCGATGDIGCFTIEQESGSAAGIRRIDALTGEAAVRRAQQRRAALRDLIDALAAPEAAAADAVRRLQSETKRLARELNALKVTVAIGGADASDAGVDLNGVTLVARRVSGMDKGSLRALADLLKSRLQTGLVVLASTTDAGRVASVVAVTADLKDRVPADQVVKAIAPIVGGGGGGRPDFAEAGGTDPQQIDAMLAESQAVVLRLLERSASGSPAVQPKH